MEGRSQVEEQVDSRRVYDGKVVSLKVDTVRLPSGRHTTREVVEHDPVIVVVPIDEEDNVLLVRQYRYPAQAALLEAPAGGIDGDESPEEAAQRELQEETGHSAGNLRKLGQFWMSPGTCTELMHAFVARYLSPAHLAPDADEDIIVEKVPLAEATGLIRRGEIQDAKTITALLMATCL